MKNITSRHTPSDIALSVVLWFGLIISFTTVVIGGVILLWKEGSTVVEYSRFIGEPTYLKHVEAIFNSALQGDALAIIQLSILLLILTPAMRVLACIIIFAYQRDGLYVALASFVFAVLIYSFI